MKETTKAMERLGRRVAGDEDEIADALVDLDRARERFLETGAPRAAVGARRWAVPVGLAAAAALVALVVWAVHTPNPIEFVIGDDAQAGVVGAWIAAPETEPLEVRFSEGTSVTLRPRSRARVAGVDATGARIVLEQGAGRVRIRPREHARWQIDVGPFEVRVTGTAFDVSWDPAADSFELHMRDGAATLSGPLVGRDRPIRAGQLARASLADKHLEIVDAQGETVAAVGPPDRTERPARDREQTEAPEEPAAQDGDGRRAAAEAGDDTAQQPDAPEQGSRKRPASADWRQLAAAGRFERALAAARAQGFARLCRTLPPAELARLADAARLAGDYDRSAQAYGTLRRRFPADPRAALAAFGLGKMEFDQQQAFASAARWFAVYLEEQPNGELAREAAGRRMEALHRAGRASAARTAAKAYLARYPKGPHALLAKRLLAD